MLRGAAASARQALMWLVMLGAAAVLAVAVLVPRLAGATPYAVRTGSMRPGYPPGTLVVVEPVDAEDVGVGDVVTYQLGSGEPAVVTHRVVAVGTDGHGDRWFQTRGDANDAPDEKWVRPVQLKGRLWYSVPQLGRLHLLLSERQHQTAVLAVAAALAGYAAFALGAARRDRLRRKAAAA